MGFLLDIQPADLGFREPFKDYRRIQNEAIDFAVDAFQGTSEEGDEGEAEAVGVVGLSLPTGSGKTLVAVSIAEALGLRAAFVSPFIGLQEQYAKLFQPYGMVDMRGKSNYQCSNYSHLDCKEGGSVGCPYVKGHGCTYEVAKKKAVEALRVTTSYAYWMNVNDQASGLERNEKDAAKWGKNPIELLVLDEGHSAPNLVADYVSCRLYEKEAKLFGDYPSGEGLVDWSAWAMEKMPVLDTMLQEFMLKVSVLGRNAKPHHLEDLHKLERLRATMLKIAFAKGDDWVIEKEVGTKYGRLWKFDCIWPGMYAKQYLFCGVPRVLVMSATLKPRTLWDLGVKKTDYKYKAWPRMFSGNRHPIMIVGPEKKNAKGETVGIGVDRKTSREDLQKVIKFADTEIIKPRLDRKGLVLSVSYDWQRQIMEESEYFEIMIGNTGEKDSDSALEVAEMFRQAKPPCLLVSPSFSTGWDFPDDQCEYIIIFKTPIIPVQSKIVQARLKRDEMYANAQTMQTLEQSCGRGMRHEKDRCEVFIIDAHAKWFTYNYRSMAQDWFQPAIRKLGTNVPKPPMRLLDERRKLA